MRRCAATLWILQHEVIRRWKRDAFGIVIVPHVVTWECLRCGRIVWETPEPVAPTPRRLHAITSIEKGRP